MDFLSAMHICDRWTFQERRRRTPVAHGDDGLEQRKICTSVIDAVEDVVSATKAT
jgi:hypothetical protein